MNCSCFNVNTFGIPMCAQLPVTYNHWEGPEDDWITVETCSLIVISENKCCADVNNWSTYKEYVSRCFLTSNSCTWPPTCRPLISTWATAWPAPLSEEARRATPSRWLTSLSSDAGIMRNLSPTRNSALQIRMSTRKAKRRKKHRQT